MKVTVQNGATHGLSRKEAEAMLPLFPTDWSRLVKSIVLYQGTGAAMEANYYPKESILGLFWPATNAASPSKTEAIEELLLALAVINERGELPVRLSSSQRSHVLEVISTVRDKCLAMVVKMQPNPAVKRDASTASLFRAPYFPRWGHILERL